MFRHLVERYQGPLFNFLAGRLRNETEVAEAAQETMVRAYFALAKLEKSESFYSWLLGIAVRVAKEMQRARWRQAGSLNVESVAGNDAVVAGLDNGTDWELSRALDELPDSLREVVSMRFYGGQSCDEISRNLGVPLGTITSRLSRAYAQLRKSLRMDDRT